MNELKFRIVLRNPPTGVDFGLQLGRTAASSLLQIQRSNGEDLHFEFPLVIVTTEETAPPDQADSPWARRLKVQSTE